MSTYRGRHAARHAAPRTGSSARGALRVVRRPAVSASLALAVVATGAAGVSAQERPVTDPAAFTLSATAQSQADDGQSEATQDGARLASARSQVNAQKSLIIGQNEEAARIAAEEAARVRAEEEARAAREAERQALIDNARTNPRGATQAIMGEFGFGQDQWGCLDKLVLGESTWNYRAKNPTSGAYGLFQSLPASKMNSVGTDWADNPVTQIRWGLQYIKSVYGTPCGAWNKWLSRSPHWY